MTFISKLSTIKNTNWLYFFAVLFLASQINLIHIVSSLHPTILKLQLTFSSQNYWNILQLWGESGLKTYWYHFRYDVFHPFIYGIFGYLFISVTQPFIKENLVFMLKWILPLAGFFDVLENTFQWYILSLTPKTHTIFITLSAIFSLFKWVLAFSFTVYMILTIFKIIFKKDKKIILNQ